MDKLQTTLSGLAAAFARSRAAAAWRTASGQTQPHPDRQRGQGLAEYALILAGIAIVAIASLTFMGGTIAEMFWDPISEDFAAVLSSLGI